MERIRKPRQFDRNMLIVCEDTNTAPNYLLRLKETAIANGCWDTIEILPKPPLDNQPPEPRPQNNPHKSARLKRNFQNTEGSDFLEFELENENREQPVSYVRTVQKALSEDLYAEGWAVFDLDGHTGHARAAEMAVELPIVNIAFSSRSIEMWFLLHFHLTNTAFQKTICKNERGHELECNKTTPCLEDGRGDCLIGFIKRNTALSDYKKKHDIAPRLELHQQNAMNNAITLRGTYDQNQPYFERNPYTTMDFLVKSLFKWLQLDDSITVGDFEIGLSQTHPNIEIQITNRTPRTQIIQKQHFVFENGDIDFEFSGGGLLLANQQRIILITPNRDVVGQKLKFPANNERDFVWFCC